MTLKWECGVSKLLALACPLHFWWHSPRLKAVIVRHNRACLQGDIRIKVCIGFQLEWAWKRIYLKSLALTAVAFTLTLLEFVVQGKACRELSDCLAFAGGAHQIFAMADRKYQESS